MSKSKVALIKCPGYDKDKVAAAVKASVDLLGGIETFVKPGESVLLKPNLLKGVAPESGITTHPEVVRGVIRLLKAVAGKIYCGDSPSAVEEKHEISQVFEMTGMSQVCEEEGIELVTFDKPRMMGGYPLTDWLSKCDRVISIPKFKTHGLTVLTGGIKNLYGLVVGMYKVTLHFEFPSSYRFSKVMLDIYSQRPPDLTVLDAIVTMEGEGPGTAGILRDGNLVAASSDAVALDTVLAKLTGLHPRDVPTNREAYHRGLGKGDANSVEIVGEEFSKCVFKDFKLPPSSFVNKIPHWLFVLARPLFLIRPKPVPGKCQGCGLCQKICPVGAITLQDKSICINTRKCILCLCCQEVCPHAAIKADESILKRMRARENS
jgi:uncharacterized protein (DUF362 family)/NAD-dependent dihydropyrimidine dehydrogenase PreA subunit